MLVSNQFLQVCQISKVSEGVSEWKPSVDLIWNDPYADDLLCWHSVESLQACLDNLQGYCTGNLIKVNVSKTEIVKFRRGGRLSRNDKLIYNNQCFLFPNLNT